MTCAVNAAWNALTCVRHPGLCLDLVSLGLVYDVRGEDGTIPAEMTLVRLGSAPGGRLPQMAQLAVTVGAPPRCPRSCAICQNT